MSREQQQDANPLPDVEENLARSFTNKTDALMGLFAPPVPPHSPGKHWKSESFDVDDTPRIQKKVRTQPETLIPPAVPGLISPRTNDERTALLSSSVSLAKHSDVTDDPKDTVTAVESSSASFRRSKGPPPTPQVFDSLFGEETPLSGGDRSSISTAGPLESCLDCDSSSLLIALCSPSTWIGSCVFLLYHVVFCLAQASAIRRPHAAHESTGSLAQMAALGVIFSGPTMIFNTAPQIPAVYPASDLFLAPFLAHMAANVDEALYKSQLHDNDAVFLATWGALVVTALVLSAIWCVAAARIRLANLGHFLPQPVLTGFFTTIGILIWTLGFSVDAGDSVGHVLTSND